MIDGRYGNPWHAVTSVREAFSGKDQQGHAVGPAGNGEDQTIEACEAREGVTCFRKRNRQPRFMCHHSSFTGQIGAALLATHPLAFALCPRLDVLRCARKLAQQFAE